MKISSKTKQFLRLIMYAWRYPRDIIYCRVTLNDWDPSWRLWGIPLIQRHKSARVVIGKGWTVCSDAKHNSLGVFQKVTIKALGSNSLLLIGDNVGMSGVSICCSYNIIIGNDVLLGSGVVVTDTDAHPLHPDERDDASLIGKGKVVIEDGAFIGARAMILKGTTVGRGAVVGAGAVVVKDVPPFMIVGGNPAKVIGEVRRKEVNKFRL